MISKPESEPEYLKTITCIRCQFCFISPTESRVDMAEMLTGP